MPSDIYVKKDTGWSTAVKNIYARTSSGWSSAIRYVYAYINAGWTRVWPFSGIYATTNPWISTTSSSSEISYGTVLRIGTTYRGNRGTFNPNGYTISSYQYKWVAYTNLDTVSSAKNYDPALVTLSGTTNDFTITGTSTANYDRGYVAFFITAKASSGSAYDGSADSLRYYVVREKPRLATGGTPALDKYTPAIGDTLNYSSSWETGDAYKIEASRSTIKWYKNLTNSTTGGTLIQNNGSYSYTVQSTDSGYYIYAVEEVFNSGTDYEFGVSTGVQASVITTSAVATAPDAFTYTIYNGSSVTAPSTPVQTRVSSTSNTVLIEIASSTPADTVNYTLNISGSGAVSGQTGNQTIATLNGFSNNNDYSVDIASTASNSPISTYVTANGVYRDIYVQFNTVSNAQSWGVNFSWTGAQAYGVTYYTNGTGNLSTLTSATATATSNSVDANNRFLIARVSGASNPTITINSAVAYNSSGQSGAQKNGTAGSTTSLSAIPRPTSTSATSTSNYTYYNPVPEQISAPYISGASGQLNVQYPGSITWYGGAYTNASSVTSVLLYGTTTASIQSSTSLSYRTANPYSLSATDPVAPAYYFGVRDTVVGINGITYYYYSYSNSYAFAILGNALTPSLSAATSTSGGFYFDVNNYDSSYAWGSSIDTTPGTVSGPTTTSPYRVTVSGLGYSVTRTITVSTSKTGYNNGSAQRSGTSNAAPAVSVNSYPSISGSGAANSNITFGAGSYNNASGITTTLRVSTSTSFSTSSGSKGSTSPYTVTTSDASAPAYYFATLDTVTGVNGLTYYFWSGGYSGSSATIPAGSGSILSYIPSYTITWNPNGGSPTNTSTATDGSTVYAPTQGTGANQVSRSGYTLLYWRDTAQLDYTYSINPGGAWTIDGRSRTFYARWQQNTVSIPPVPTGVGLTGSGSVSWTGDASATSYEIQFYTASNGSGANAAGPYSVTGITSSPYQLTSPYGGTNANWARVQVRARNSAGASNYSAWVPSATTYT